MEVTALGQILRVGNLSTNATKDRIFSVNPGDGFQEELGVGMERICKNSPL